MARYRTYTTAFKRQLVEEHLGSGTSLNQLARQHNISRELLRTWLRKYEAGELTADERRHAAHRACETRIAGLERKVGQLTMELDLLKKGLNSARQPRSVRSSIVSGPAAAASKPDAGS
jgi:transposase-like protein